MNEQLETLRKELTEGTAQLFDVREEEEWNAGHLADAVLAPLSELHASLEPEGVDKNRKTYLYCRSGRRVHEAAPLLESMGYINVIPLPEGFEELLEEGFPPDEK